MSASLSVTVLLVTLAVVAALGLLAARRGRGEAGLTIAPRSQGALARGLSFAASGLGAWVLFAPAELGSLLGIGAVLGYGFAAAVPYLVFALVGPRVRARWPSGRGVTDTLRQRHGALVARSVLVVSVAYMAVFVTAELVAIADVVEAGLAGAYLAALAATGSLAEAWAAVLVVGAVPTLPPFAGAVGASALVTVALAAIRPATHPRRGRDPEAVSA